MRKELRSGVVDAAPQLLLIVPGRKAQQAIALALYSKELEEYEAEQLAAPSAGTANDTALPETVLAAVPVLLHFQPE
ncbi:MULTISPECIES: hypothetical protein [unclassified Micromonospora]|uniref:hypothetical protein n=1 Tax=unclassified Micromonospora TaxID=2617518 RepID=UPI003A8B8D09